LQTCPPLLDHISMYFVLGNRRFLHCFLIPCSQSNYFSPLIASPAPCLRSRMKNPDANNPSLSRPRVAMILRRLLTPLHLSLVPCVFPFPSPSPIPSASRFPLRLLFTLAGPRLLRTTPPAIYNRSCSRSVSSSLSSYLSK
jgi:hypothetical protein